MFWSSLTLCINIGSSCVSPEAAPASRAVRVAKPPDSVASSTSIVMNPVIALERGVFKLLLHYRNTPANMKGVLILRFLYYL